MYASIQLGQAGASIHDSGAGPDEPRWYFTSREDLAAAIEACWQKEVDFNVSSGGIFPEEGSDDLEDFTDYLEMQL